MATVNANVFASHTRINLSYVRNGAPANVSRSARAASLSAKYHFRGVRHVAALLGDVAGRRAPCPVAVLVEAQFRAAFRQLVEAEVEAARAAHAAAPVPGGGGPAPVFNEAGARADAVARASNRIEAIGLGAVHAALVSSYRIVQADLVLTEVGAALLALTPPAAAGNDAAFVARLRTTTHGWQIALASGHLLAAATASEQVMLDAPGLSEEEAELAYALMLIGIGSPVRAGSQLFIDGHHYHSDAESSARCRAIEREVIGRMSAGAKALWRGNLGLLRNAVWHAGIHFVSADTLQTWAEDVQMPERLQETGVGSLSVGLPAQEALFSRANSYLTVLNSVAQTARAHGHTVDLNNLRATVTALSALPRRGALPPQRPALPGAPAAAWPAGCNTRARALKLFLEPALDTAEPVAAWLFGYYREICSRAGVRANSVEGSLLRSYSLKRAVANHVGEANRAVEMYSARARYIRAQAEQGTLETYTGRA